MISSSLNQPKEPTPYFHLSFFQDKTCDMLHPLSGFYKVPTLAYYGAGYPFGDMVGLIALPGNLVNLPKNVIDLIKNVPEVMQYQREPTKGGKIFNPVNIEIPRVRSVRFYWVVTDISELVHKKGEVINLVNHAWVFENFTGGRQISHIPSCVLNIEGFSEIRLNGVKFDELRVEYMSMHFKQGALCISPNNHKLKLNHTLRMNKCWTVSLDPRGEEAVVSLQWVILDPVLSQPFYNSTNLSELIASLDNREIYDLFRY